MNATIEELLDLLKQASGGVVHLAGVANCNEGEWSEWDRKARAAIARAEAALAAPQPAADGWIPWAGTTKYPTDIQPHTNVEVKLRCGETVERLAYSFDWTIDGTTGDIIAYRIVRK